MKEFVNFKRALTPVSLPTVDLSEARSELDAYTEPTVTPQGLEEPTEESISIQARSENTIKGWYISATRKNMSIDWMPL